jgi:hypothetical protein
VTNFAKKAKLINALLSVEYGFTDAMTSDERDKLDVERQAFVLRMGWSWMSIEELEKQCKDALGKLPY